MSHPLLNKQSLLYYLFVWAILAIAHFLILRFLLNLPLINSALDSLISNGLYAVMALSFWHPCKFISLERGNFQRVIANHLLGSAVSSAIWLAIIFSALTKVATPVPVYQQFFLQSLPWRFFSGVLFYFIMVTFYYLLIYYHEFHQKLIRESELKTLVKEAQLETLKFQINPHFIFNSLNSINSLIQTVPERAGEMTVKLADFLRATLSGNELPTKILRDELTTAMLYLEIEKVRFGEKINYSEEIAEGCLDIPVPHMILQPLIENAVKHGVYESLETVNIRFQCNIQGDFLVMRLKNNYDPETVSGKGAGIGLKNINSRLEMLYGRDNLMKVEKDDNIFKVSVYIPLRS